MTEQQTIDHVIKWVRDTVSDDINLLVPISGGTDSALCFYICSQAFPQKTHGVFAGTTLHSSGWFEQTGTVQYAQTKTEPNAPGWEAEIARWSEFMSLAIHENRMLVGSRNRTEQILGTYSMASRVAWFYPILGLWKHDVLELCRYIGVPPKIIASSNDADPACGRPPELARIPHKLIDAFVQSPDDENQLQLSGLEPEQIAYLRKIYQRNKFKQSLPRQGPSIGLLALP